MLDSKYWLNKPDCDRSRFPATRRASVVNLGVLTMKTLGVLWMFMDWTVRTFLYHWNYLRWVACQGQKVRIWWLDNANFEVIGYPGGLSCTNPNSGFTLVRNYYQWFANYSFTQPNFFPEFEGGYFTPWGGSFYDDCLAEHDPAFADVYYKNARNLEKQLHIMLAS